MADILDDLKAVRRNNGHTYSSYEVLGMVSRAIEEIAELRAALAAAQRVAGEDELDTEKLWTLSETLGDREQRALVRAAADVIERLRAALALPGKEPDLGWLQGDGETIRERRPSDEPQPFNAVEQLREFRKGHPK